MVIVNTVVIVRGMLGLGQREVALTLAAYGGGSMFAALLVPRLLDKLNDRMVMVGAAAILAAGLGTMGGLFAAGMITWTIVLIGWTLLGIAYSMSVTPAGRLLRRSANSEDRPALFAAQFALSHGCWLISYPIAGQIGAKVDQATAFLALSIVAGVGTLIAIRVWPKRDPEIVPHQHEDLPADHPHLIAAHGKNAMHDFVIDDLHPEWPPERG